MLGHKWEKREAWYLEDKLTGGVYHTSEMLFSNDELGINIFGRPNAVND